MSARHLGVLVLIIAGVFVFVSDLRLASGRPGGEVIAGPYSYLLASSTDLGPSRDGGVQLTMALRDEHRPTGVFAWADGHGLSVRWRPGHQWAVVEGPAASVADAFDVEIHDYRGRRGQVFYASRQQPYVPNVLRQDVFQVGRILGYVPHHTSHTWTLPLDVPDKGLTPEALRNTYNAAPLAAAGYTGKGTTIVFFAFDGFDQADLDSFADTHELPRFTPEVIGELDEPRGEATMDLQVAHAVAPDARKVVVSALPTVTTDGAFERIGQMLEETDRRYPGAVWSFSIGWGCDKLLTAADLAPVRSALATAQSHGTSAFNASGDLAGLECKGGDDWSSPPGESDIGLDSVASLPEMTAVGGTTLSTDSRGRWLSEQAWFDVPLSVGTGGGVSAVFDRPDWQRGVWPDRDTDRRLTPDVAAVADPFTGVRIVFRQTPLVGGGTSQAAPIWAGLAAVMNQYLLANGGRLLGELNPLLYRIARGAPLPAFRDVTLGGNAVADAAPGYDLVTGLGTPDVDNLVRNVLILQKAAP
ncbi:peptidase S53 [Mycobacterium sp. GA-1285]|uniref:S53 family peptidase n=1 Tax=Mycobacterium sp. GA-1285 TaxID=1772282 RepID=UPI00074849A7|nr:S53 family peptidase [Mycobacterium sp. GA-1285]KUI19740.1 peptidase S53 [Mycobacterium sp. GA-1285]